MKYFFRIILKIRILFLAGQANRYFFDKKDYNVALKKYKELKSFIKNNINNFGITEKEYTECSVAMLIRVAEEMSRKNIPLQSVPTKEVALIRAQLIKEYNEKYGERSDKGLIFSTLIDCSVSEVIIPSYQKLDNSHHEL